MSKWAVYALCAAACFGVAGNGSAAIKCAIGALVLAGCRAAWLFFAQEDIADVYERRAR